jgi:hypothetical protein
VSANDSVTFEIGNPEEFMFTKTVEMSTSWMKTTAVKQIA